MMEKIFAVIPAFNEEGRIGQVIKDIEKFVDKIIVIDDGSTDQTATRVQSRKAVVLKHLCNLGQGAAFQTGFEYARRSKAEIVITYDADGQFKASEIPNLLRPILQKEADIVLGSRFLGQAENITLRKLITLKLGIIFTLIFSEINLTDTHNGFRALNRKALKKIMITQNRMAHASEIIDQIKKNKLKYKEVPVTVLYDNYTRQKGQSVFNALRIAFDLVSKRLY